MSGYLPSDVSRPAWPHFDDAPEAEDEHAAYADWRRDNPYARATDADDEPEMQCGADYAEREEARAVGLFAETRRG